ncbi:hypothetical protein EK21DRAFT_71285 [Setomelanomma holmii]|uniref:2EXR domain-containing protein n=1 Tax=Setomelanomma holmii TaxID=210430 RepID=A0A9P4H619_9PLEO|nr:hypothetical protein EK21DRAFT_71285 [Setomelanomma holmii]
MSTFYPFPRLPLVLRLAIWEMTVEPREVEVRIVQPMPEDPREPYVHMVSSTIPAALHTCREARNHGLYRRISLDVDEQHGTDRRYVWLNLNIDLIDIGKSHLVYFLPIASSIQGLRLNSGNFYYEKDLLRFFLNVEKIHVVCIDRFWDWGDGVDACLWPCAIENVVFIDEDAGYGKHVEGDYLEVQRIQHEIAEERMIG